MAKIKIAYVDRGDIYAPFIAEALKGDTIEVVKTPSANPDIVICSTFGVEHKQYNRFKKLWITGENDYPNFNEYDYAISCHDIQYGNRHLRIPFYVFRHQYQLVHQQDSEFTESMLHDAKLADKYLHRKFCSAVISNVGCADPRRSQFFHAINNRWRVDSAGKAFNNVGKLEDIQKTVPSGLKLHNPIKHYFISNYKFNLAFENSVSEGYVTEKIIDAFAARTIPIYFGTIDATLEFDSNTYIDATTYQNMDELLARIDQINKDNDLYMSMLLKPKFRVPVSLCSSVRMSHDNLSYTEQFNDYIRRVVANGKVQERQYGWINTKI